MAEEEKKEAEETEENAESEDSGEPKKSGLKKILIIVIPILIIVGGVIFYFFGLSAPETIEIPTETVAESSNTSPASETPKTGASGEVSQESYFVEMPPITVNLRRTDQNHQRYLKLSVRFEVREYDHVSILENIMPRIRDQFQVFLRELRVDDLEGSTGAYRIREELLHRINIVARPAVVTDVLFDELLIQ